VPNKAEFRCDADTSLSLRQVTKRGAEITGSSLVKSHVSTGSAERFRPIASRLSAPCRSTEANVSIFYCSKLHTGTLTRFFLLSTLQAKIGSELRRSMYTVHEVPQVMTVEWARQVTEH
jgi:hypothetical protein